MNPLGRQYYIHNVPVFVVGEPEENLDFPEFCTDAEDLLTSSLLTNIDVTYVGDFPELNGRNATYANGAIYMSGREPTNFDMLENFVHEVAHSLEPAYGEFIYSEDFLNEFRGKRQRLCNILKAHGYNVSDRLCNFIEYNAQFDNFLAHDVGYPTLLNLTMGLFASPYGATSIQEYFANGFEKYLLEDPRSIKTVSPILYRKIESILNDEA